jgi:hypothetical protein
MVERHKQDAALRKPAQAVETNGIQALENVPAFPVLRGVALFFDEPLYLFEAR